MSDFRLMAVEVALRAMFTKGHFDICTIRSICETLELTPPKALMRELQLLHCVDYSDMPPAMLEALPDKIAELLRSPVMDASRINLVFSSGAQALRVVSHG